MAGIGVVEQTTVNPVRSAMESIVKATQDHGTHETRPYSKEKVNSLSLKFNYGDLLPETQAMLKLTGLPVDVPDQNLQVEVITTEDIINDRVKAVEIRYSGWEAKKNSYQAKLITLGLDPIDPSTARLRVQADLALPSLSIRNLSLGKDPEYLRTKTTIPDLLNAYTAERNGDLSLLIIETSQLIAKQPKFSNNGSLLS